MQILENLNLKSIQSSIFAVNIQKGFTSGEFSIKRQYLNEHWNATVRNDTSVLNGIRIIPGPKSPIVSFTIRLPRQNKIFVIWCRDRIQRVTNSLCR